MMTTDFERVGVAITRPSAAGRQDTYGVYAMTEAYGRPIEPPALYVKYEGYKKGDTQVGLPLAGPNAAHLQPLLDFAPASPTWATVRFFREGPWS